MKPDQSINIENYEPFVLDYLEGNLNKLQECALMAFLEKNPSIKAEMEDLMQGGIEEVRLEAPILSMSDKTELYHRSNFIVDKKIGKRILIYGIAACFSVLLGIGIFKKYQFIPQNHGFSDAVAVLELEKTSDSIDSIVYTETLADSLILRQASASPPCMKHSDTKQTIALNESKVNKVAMSNEAIAECKPRVQTSEKPMEQEPQNIEIIVPKIQIITPKIEIHTGIFKTPELKTLTLPQDSFSLQNEFQHIEPTKPSIIEQQILADISKDSLLLPFKLPEYLEDFENYAMSTPRAKIKNIARKIISVFYHKKNEIEYALYKYEKSFENLSDNISGRQKNENTKK